VTDVLPPHSIEAEEAVLGAILINPQALLDVLPMLHAGDFYLEHHGWIYEALLALHDCRTPVDVVTLSHELSRRQRLEEAGGLAYLLALTNKTPSSLHAAGYAQLVAERAWRRRVLAYCGSVARLAHEADRSIPEIHQQIVGLLRRLGGGLLRGPRTMRDLAGEFLDEAADVARGGQPLTGWTTGFRMLDRLLASAYRPGAMTVIGGYTNQGKTQVAAQMALAAGAQGPTLYVTLESEPRAIFSRLVAALSGVPLTRVIQRDLRSGRDYDRALEAASTLSGLSIEVETLESLGEIERYLGDMSIRYGFAPGMVFVDDVDSLAESVRGGSDYERLKRAATGLLRLTHRTGWGVVALKQLLMPKEARGVTSSARLKELLTPTIMSFEGGGSITQKGGNIVTMLSAEWIRTKVYAQFQHADLREGFTYFRKLKARDARSDSVVEAPLRFNADIPRYEDVAPDIAARAGGRRSGQTDVRVYGQATHELEDDLP